ncbi:hypothetical protein GPJ56_009186 [Histomonas meleagridis]|uniref:uncharacterized protein n=1 Tax=Histomonas meleagridis TaxID=135588 RepID=UPI003559D666|nr:hypothetical protein GPJ56_009186 [Histomonas meleagridis]KAH0801558.1 hypothetical protein GO595_005557 [Histomonas meleagridis]
MSNEQNPFDFSYQGLPNTANNSDDFTNAFFGADDSGFNQDDFQFSFDNEPISDNFFDFDGGHTETVTSDSHVEVNPFSFNLQQNKYLEDFTPIQQTQDFGFWGNTSQPTAPGHKRTSSRTDSFSPDTTFEQPKQQPRNHRTKTAPIPGFKQSSHRKDFFEVGQNAHAISLPNKTEEDRKFAELCHDETVQINPFQIGFIPHNYFRNQFYTFGNIVGDYFQKKNNPNCRFLHKLYNAIKLGEAYPEYLIYVGISWISNEVIQVSKYRFARLLGIKTIDGSLFHRQGNFPSFGFTELSGEEIIREFGSQKLNSMDCDVDKLLKHEEGIFVRNGNIQQILEMCKWKSSKVRD